MKEVLLQDVMLYIEVWTLAVIIPWLIFTYHLWNFYYRKHPEIFKPDKIDETKKMLLEKAELRRQYHNKSLISIFIILFWAFGTMAICMPAGQRWFIWLLTGLSVLLLLLGLHRK